MTYRLIVLILFISFETLSQDNVAIIKDRDGFANVREGKTTNSPIVGQIKNGEFFTFKKSNEDWWEIDKRYDENGLDSDVSGFVHKSKIQSLFSLPYKDKRELIRKIFEKEKELIKAQKRDERERHHEPKFDMILNAAADHIIKTKDSELLRLFIEIIKLDTGSADEAPSWTLGFIFIKQPDWTIEQLRVVGLDQYLIDILDFGFENIVTKSDDYSGLKDKIKSLK